MLKRWPTAGALLARHNGIGPGFNYLRILLALEIWNLHAGAIAHGKTAAVVGVPVAASLWTLLRTSVYAMLVPMFFALSGFLVTASALRLCSVKSFLIFRSLRIFPALTVEVLLSAFLLGPLFTILPLGEYFTRPMLYQYTLNILGIVHYFLPGVFVNNPLNIVNNNLWTLPSEFYCYLITSGLLIFSVLYNRRLFSILFLLTTLALIAFGFRGYGLRVPGIDTFPAPVVIYCFFLGCFFYHWREHLRIGFPAIILAGAVALALVAWRGNSFLAPFFVTYFTVGLGVISWPKFRLIEKGDYSYGIYLFGYPITQAVAAALPALREHTLAFRGLSLTLTIAFAVLSWHYLEKPALKLKKYFGTPAPTQGGK